LTTKHEVTVKDLSNVVLNLMLIKNEQVH